MTTLFFRFFLLMSIILMGIFYSCQDDDICIDSITPRLIVGFRDAATQTAKPLDSINVYRYDNSTNKWIRIYKGASKSKIELGLNINDETSTLLKFSQTHNVANADQITVKYSNSDEFISKACGFKRVYKNVTYTLKTPAVIFKNTKSNITDIIDESNTHLYIDW